MYLRLAIVGLVGVGFCIFAMFMLQDVTKGLTKKQRDPGQVEAQDGLERRPARVTGSLGAYLPAGPLDPAKRASVDPKGIVPDVLSQHARREIVQQFTLHAGRRPTALELEELIEAFHRDVLALPGRLVEARLSPAPAPGVDPGPDAPEKGE
ncbi:MAG: hypothetical protein H6834_17800 [Planctomycetes bacterium]|nr:hypothetical protein [Planctomycetota bacterium]